MATPAHCAYCFESLTASLEKRQPLSLAQVEELWEKYTCQGDEEEEQEEAEADPVVDTDEDMTEDMEPPTALKPTPAISRLVGGGANSPASASASSTNTSSSSIPSTSTATTSSSSAASSRSSAPTSNSSRSSIFSALRRTTAASRPTTDEQQQSNAISSTEAHPLFVTWNTISSRSGSKSLRGCIGTFEAQELSDGLRSYALTSAFDDSRFPPITARELPTLSCSVTLLTNFQPAASAMAWELGRHGLRISFTYHGRRYGATYLPDVAKEQGWTKEETIVSLMRKAGWSGRRDEWQRVPLNVVTYEGSKSSLSWDEWRAWREWCQGELGVAGRREMN